MRIGSLIIIKEKAAIISPNACWVIFHKEWMYGPTDTLFQCLYLLVTQWKSDHNYVG